MLAETKLNCQHLSVQNVELMNLRDGLDQVRERFNLIHSHIVMQHIPTDRGLVLFEQLANLLCDGGIGVIHFTFGGNRYSKQYGFPNAFQRFVRFKLVRVYRQCLRLCGRSVEPEMQMHSYNLSKICFILQSHGVRRTHLEFTDHDGALGAVVYFQKPSVAGA